MSAESLHDDLVCTCCGMSIQDNAKENAWYGEKPYPGDTGTGMCRKCGGDPEAKEPRARLGFSTTCFVDARIPFVAERLSRDNRQRFFAMPYEEQANFVLHLVGKGVIT